MINIGKIVGTHGIKGEIRIKSTFEHKEKVFKKDFKIYFNDSEHIIKSYRRHKDFEMITFDEFNNINDVIKFKGLDVFIRKEDLDLNNKEYLNDDLIGLKVYFNNNFCGNIIDFVYNKGNNLLMIEKDDIFYIPMHDNFVEKIDIENQRIDVKNVEGLIK